ncbi:hypothetical protein QA641_16540 [Bradyrhizobium sp. CB1650]|uniref:hypothetical protein n=1 Tax=Bradyrhizobium sp. CB1650 TaxID=3039153 RepID=UPI0024348AAB|nr:hypothetical protein [Bradyrhizobium sp. CB1650]WGD55336.1 hypothetical protein QA641_16540 [Bradyrhizobium sp. CB1650]
MAKSHYTADSAIVSAFKLAIHDPKDRQRSPDDDAVHALARGKSANEAMLLPSPLN